MMEVSVTATLAARTRSPEASVGKSGRAALRRAIYAPIDDNRTAASDSDIVAAWLAATIAGLTLIATLAF